LSFQNTLLQTVIPDGLDGYATNITDVNGGTYGTVAFSYALNGMPKTAQINITDPYVIVTNNRITGTSVLSFNTTAIYLLLGLSNLTQNPCPLTVGYCTGINDFYTATGKPISDCNTFTATGLLGADIFFFNGSLAQKGLT